MGINMLLVWRSLSNCLVCNLSPQYNWQFHTLAVNLISVSHEHLARANRRSCKTPVITTNSTHAHIKAILNLWILRVDKSVCFKITSNICFPIVCFAFYSPYFRITFIAEFYLFLPRISNINMSAVNLIKVK